MIAYFRSYSLLTYSIFSAALKHPKINQSIVPNELIQISIPKFFIDYVGYVT